MDLENYGSYEVYMLILSVLIGNKSRNGQGVNGVLCVCLTVSKQVYMISIGKISAQTIS